MNSRLHLNLWGAATVAFVTAATVRHVRQPVGQLLALAVLAGAIHVDSATASPGWTGVVSVVGAPGVSHPARVTLVFALSGSATATFTGFKAGTSSGNPPTTSCVQRFNIDMKRSVSSPPWLYHRQAGVTSFAHGGQVEGTPCAESTSVVLRMRPLPISGPRPGWQVVEWGRQGDVFRPLYRAYIGPRA